MLGTYQNWHRQNGRVLDPRYTRLLMSRDDLPLADIILLDKVQKEERISKEDAARLRKCHLVEGRYPNLYVSALPLCKGTDGFSWQALRDYLTTLDCQPGKVSYFEN